MRIVSNFVCYQYKQFVMSAKWVMPFVVFVLFLGVQYSIVPVGVVSSFAISGLFLLWIIPPVSDVVSWFSNVDYFDMKKLVMGVLVLIVYGLIMALIKIELLCRRKF